MILKSTLLATCVLVLAQSCVAQDDVSATPNELEVLKGSIGVWDAEIEVWPQGPDADSIKFQGVETIRPFGKHWMSSDFDSEFGGQTMSIHSIVGYDLDKKKLVGMVVDEGPYMANMTGEYDKESATVHWVTKAKDPEGNIMVQNTSITQKSEDERVLVLMVPGATEGETTKFMEIVFKKRD